MKTSLIFACLISLMALPVPAAFARGNDMAIGTCRVATIDKLADAGYRGETRFGDSSVKPIKRNEFSVTGGGKTGNSRFSFICRYNSANDRAYHVDVKVSAAKKSSSGNNVAGAIIGAAIAAAIIDSVNKGDRQDNGYAPRRVDYPEPGVECYPDQSACYRNGSFDARYTRQYYADGE